MSLEFNGSYNRKDGWKFCEVSNLYYPESMFVESTNISIHPWCMCNNIDLTKTKFTEQEEKILTLINRTYKYHKICSEINCVYNQIYIQCQTNNQTSIELLEKLNFKSVNKKYNVYNSNPDIDFDKAILVLKDNSNN